MSDMIYVDNTRVPRVDDNNSYFLHRLTILYGPSASGKSSLINHILSGLKRYIPVIIVCCPTATMNGDYDGIAPAQCIHDDLSKDLLKKIFQRQTNMLAMYELVRSSEHIEPLYDRISTDDSRLKIEKLKSIYAQGCKYIKDTYEDDDSEPAIKDLTDKYIKKKVKIMRGCIRENMSKLQLTHLTEMQKTILRNFSINSSLVLVIDDCAASIKEWKDLTETKQLFFQGRHFKVTTILTMQNEAIIPPPLRTNAHISIFTTAKIVNTYFAKASSGASPSERKEISKIADCIFAPSEDRTRPNYKKLVVFGQIIKTDHRIQYIIANPKKKRFGSVALWDLCNKVKREISASISSNSFSKMFALKNAPTLETIPQ